MTSYVFDIGEKTRKASRFISHVRSELQRALVEEKTARKLTQQSIAEKISVNRSVVNRQFMGEENLTLRSVAELAWAMGWEPSFFLKKREMAPTNNYECAFRAVVQASSAGSIAIPADSQITLDTDAFNPSKSSANTTSKVLELV